MSFRGMDLEAVDGLAGRLQLQAQAVAAIVTVVDGAVSGLAGVWSGDDLHAFTAVWHQTHRPRAQSLSSSLEGWVTALRNQVRQQTITSSDQGGGPRALRAVDGPGAVTARSGRNQTWALDMALLSRAAYGKGCVPAGFKLDKEVRGSNGFVANVYEYKKADGTIGYVIAYRGSESPFKHLSTDWVHNDISDKLGVGATQYKQSVDLARNFVREHPNAEVTFTGHSLGGGLASAASIATGQQAITYNAAEPGYSDIYYAMHPGQQPTHLQFAEQTVNLHHLAPDTSHITTFRTADDPLTLGESVADGHQSALGTQHTLTYTHLQTRPDSAHGMDNVIASVQDDHSSWWQ